MVKGFGKVVFLSEEGSIESEHDLRERTAKAAVEAAVFAERHRCARVALNAWMNESVRANMADGLVSVCDRIAALIEETT